VKYVGPSEQSDEYYCYASSLRSSLVRSEKEEKNLSERAVIILVANPLNQQQQQQVLIALFFLRPAIDAYRVSTSFDDTTAIINPLSEMVYNKCTELACESIPGCVLQIYVYLINKEEAGTFALGSIAISALTTGFTSAMIAFDFDVDVYHRKMQPKFYGYIPDDNGRRSNCFALMTMIGALHNLSRSVGCALLVAAASKRWAAYILGVEVALYVIYKIVRRDFWYVASERSDQPTEERSDQPTEERSDEYYCCRWSLSVLLN